MSSNVGKKCFQLWCVLCAVQFVTHELHGTQPGDHPVGSVHVKGKGLPQQAEVAQGVPGRLRPRIFLTFGTSRVVDRQPHAPVAFTPGGNPGTHF
jgi:hypothetical protein